MYDTMESVFAGAAAYHLYVSLMCCYLYSPERKEGKKKKKKTLCAIYLSFQRVSPEYRNGGGLRTKFRASQRVVFDVSVVSL
jgi:hypothetical protein